MKFRTFNTLITVGIVAPAVASIYVLYNSLHYTASHEKIDFVWWVHLLMPLLLILIFAAAYYFLHQLVLKPLFLLDAYVIGEVKDIPHSRIAEIEELSRRVEKQIKTLHELAYFDSLTHIQNRRSIERTLDLALATAKRDQKSFSIALIDLDNFKTINDTYGHDYGDILLCSMVARIKKHLREVDQIGRLGGDEFLIVFHPEEESSQSVLHALERIRTLFEEPFVINDVSMISTLSIGVATYPDCGMTRKALLKYADEAMYQVKRQGGNGIVEEHIVSALIAV
ncbi:MAG: hypothetical protein DSZ05_02360 [Sulfurospirillum sp.]|nr:MAG: hypothetical protein DSZ05_02360 [Sulfurospirillum sp.]